MMPAKMSKMTKNDSTKDEEMLQIDDVVEQFQGFKAQQLRGDATDAMLAVYKSGISDRKLCCRTSVVASSTYLFSSWRNFKTDIFLKISLSKINKAQIYKRF